MLTIAFGILIAIVIVFCLPLIITVLGYGLLAIVPIIIVVGVVGILTLTGDHDLSEVLLTLLGSLPGVGLAGLFMWWVYRRAE
ncbi:hypothetical protein [Brucella intermedia]|uniref:hypothetical protein n=1 Tax=Brucella intermedia TaxID=94625 RepID=UPI00236088BB|nr:hypothetical protein [Brucella intermedia]